MENGTNAAVILISELMQHKPFARGEAHAETPILPAHLVAVDAKTGALRLQNLERLQIFPQRAYCFRSIKTRHGRERHLNVVDYFDHFHRFQIDESDEPLHR